jgi:hypothetical protein
LHHWGVSDRFQRRGESAWGGWRFHASILFHYSLESEVIAGKMDKLLWSQILPLELKMCSSDHVFKWIDAIIKVIQRAKAALPGCVRTFDRAFCKIEIRQS